MGTNQLGLDENLGPLASADLDNAESKYCRRTAKQREGVVQGDRQLADPCKRTLGAESVFGSNYKIHNLSCEGSGNMSDPELSLGNGCLRGIGVSKNGLAEELKPNIALGMVRESQDGSSSEPVQQPVIRLSLESSA